MPSISARSLALLMSFFALLVTDANAGDLGARRFRPLAYDWSGLHVGITGGYAFDGHDPSFTFENVELGHCYDTSTRCRPNQRGRSRWW